MNPVCEHCNKTNSGMWIHVDGHFFCSTDCWDAAVIQPYEGSFKKWFEENVLGKKPEGEILHGSEDMVREMERLADSINKNKVGKPTHVRPMQHSEVVDFLDLDSSALRALEDIAKGV